MKRNLLIISLLSVFVLFAACTQNQVTQLTIQDDYEFLGKRTDYVLDLSQEGTLVTNRQSGETLLVPYGEAMFFDGQLKYSKNTSYIMHNIRSHAETYVQMHKAADLPVDFLRNSAYWSWDDKSPIECMEKRFETIVRFPDKADKVIVSYANSTGYTNIGNWDAAFDPAWDKDKDGRIDDSVDNLPEYVDINLINNAWVDYTARFWTEAWYEVMEHRIDLIAAQHFDGIMLDVMDGYGRWADYEYHNNPTIPYDEYSQKYAQLMIEYIEHISSYAKQTYGTAFMITGNLDHDSYSYFDNLGHLLDGGYYQNAVFSWDGTGIAQGTCLSDSDERYENERIDFIFEQGLSVINMDHLGRGKTLEGLDWDEGNDKEALKMENFLLLFEWAIESGSTPYITPVFFEMPYSAIGDTSIIDAMIDTALSPGAYPRFSRVLEGVPPFTDTDYNDWVIASDSDDVILTGGGNDLVYAGAGNDDVDCGEGIDGAYYRGTSSEYLVYGNSDSLSITNLESGEKDLFDSLEYIVFLDQVKIIE